MFLDSGSKQVTSTTVPWSTGNCVVVSSFFSHSVGSPVQTPANDKKRLQIICRNLLNFNLSLFPYFQ